jgi:glycosyltransferase involved in cell wall biosynthesis
MTARILVRRKPSPACPVRPHLLFISPVVPDDRGNGLAMRGALFLHALTGLWNVHLLVVPVAGAMPTGDAWPAATRRCVELVALAPEEDRVFRFILSLRDPAYRLAALEGYRYPALARFALPPAVAAAAGALAGRRFEAVHVFRLYMAPFAEPFLAGARSSLDLDDDDARTARSLAALARWHGQPAQAALDTAEADKLAAFQARWAPRFDRVCLACPGDAERALARLPGLAAICVPNAVHLPSPPAPSRSGDGPFTLLFVGSLGYLPNHDAAVLLASEVLPSLRRHTSRSLRLILAGRDPGAELRALARPPEIEVTGPVEDLAPLYAASDVVLAPLRAGGGTRIKILEAFAHRRPVIATPLGAEGIAACDGEHLLLAEGAGELVTACLRLMQDPAFGAGLAARAYALVSQEHRHEVVTARIGELLAPARA